MKPSGRLISFRRTSFSGRCASVQNFATKIVDPQSSGISGDVSFNVRGDASGAVTDGDIHPEWVSSGLIAEPDKGSTVIQVIILLCSWTVDVPWLAQGLHSTRI